MIPSTPIVEPVFVIDDVNNDPTYRRFYIKGDLNNMFYMKSTDKTITVSLKLSSEKRQREIGMITKSTKTMFVRRERSKHLFHKMGGYGFCHHILRYQSSFDWISLSDEFQDWKIPVKYILENGKFLEFKNNGGFEIQIFIRLDQIKQFEIKKEENRRI